MQANNVSAVSAVAVGRQIASGDWVLRECSVTFSPGSLTAIAGASGAGKTSLMYCLSGLDAPTAGQVLVEGQDIYAMSRQARATFLRSRVGFVFQQYNLVSYLSVDENVTLPLSLAGKRADRQALAQILERFGLTEKTGAAMGALSGGEQQRVALCRVLLAQPAIVFADEPTGALDSTNSRLVLEVLRELADAGITVVMVTHDVDAAVRADRVVFMRDGSITGVGSGLDAGQVLAGMRQPVRRSEVR